MERSQSPDKNNRYLGLQALAVAIVAIICDIIAGKLGYGRLSPLPALIVGTTGGLILLGKDMLRNGYVWIFIGIITTLNIAMAIAVNPPKNFKPMSAAPVFLVEILMFLALMRAIQRRQAHYDPKQ